MFGQISDLRLDIVVDLFLLILLEEIDDSFESMFRQFVGDLHCLIILKIGLKGLLELFESFLIIKKTLNLRSKLLRKNSPVILSAHDLHIDCEVEVSEEAMSGFHLVLGSIHRVLWCSLLLNFGCIFVNLSILNLEMFDLRLLDLAVSNQYIAEHASLLLELLQGGSQVFHLG